MNREEEKCPTCANELISETRIVDIGLFQHQWEYSECLTCKKQWTFSKNEIRVKVSEDEYQKFLKDTKQDD